MRHMRGCPFTIHYYSIFSCIATLPLTSPCMNLCLVRRSDESILVILVSCSSTGFMFGQRDTCKAKIQAIGIVISEVKTFKISYFSYLTLS